MRVMRYRGVMYFLNECRGIRGPREFHDAFNRAHLHPEYYRHSSNHRLGTKEELLRILENET